MTTEFPGGADARPAHSSAAYRARALQDAIHADGARFKVLVCHRRFGKTVLAVNALIDAAAAASVPAARFAYIAPTYPQAKRAAWDYLKRFAAAVDETRFDAELVKANAAGADALGRASRARKAQAHENELRVDFANGRRITLFGADDPDSLRGIYLDGVVFDEFGQMPPAVWSEVVRPMLVDRRGFALFIGTPKGQNAFFELWRALPRAGWRGFLYKASDTGLVPADELAAARRDMSAEEYDQEFECSFSAAILGAYFGREIAAAEASARIGAVAYDPRHAVYTGWDIGYNDPTVIWFVQMIPGADDVEARWIDYYQNRGEGLDHYVAVLNAKGYRYAAHYLPHDVGHHEWGASGATRLAMLKSHGLEVRVAPLVPIDDGIEALRRLLRRSAFDGGRCAVGLDALRHYRSEWDERRGVFVRQPLHDWASHAADAARSFALGFETRSRLTPSSREDTAEQHYDMMRW
jgi:hypothetical protein